MANWGAPSNKVESPRSPLSSAILLNRVGEVECPLCAITALQGWLRQSSVGHRPAVTQFVAELDPNPAALSTADSGRNSTVDPGFAVLTWSKSTPSTCTLISSPENPGGMHPVFPPPRSIWGSMEIKQFHKLQCTVLKALFVFLELRDFQNPLRKSQFHSANVFWCLYTPDTVFSPQ